MKITFITSLFCLLFAFPASAEPLTEAELVTLTENFLKAKNQRQQPDSNVQDVEHFLSLLADEFIDEHVKFDVTVTSKDELRAGMIAKLQDKIFFSNITVLQIMTGRNVTFVKFKEHAKGQPSHMDNPIEYTAVNIMSLEFNDQGKIKHIRRHHGL
jgi:hypothetical protein